MRTHRFFVDGQELTHSFWLQDEKLIFQWKKVLRYSVGDTVVLFDGVSEDRLYTIEQMEDTAAKLTLVTQMERQLPRRHIILFWSLLKKDKNDWVIQKATELGVSELVPIFTARTEKTGFDQERARKIAIEASEQCGRSTIPVVREPMNLAEAIGTYYDNCVLLVCEAGSDSWPELSSDKPIGLLVGPEGGWTTQEKELFAEKELKHAQLGQFTLRAETAAITSIALAALF